MSIKLVIILINLINPGFSLILFTIISFLKLAILVRFLLGVIIKLV